VHQAVFTISATNLSVETFDHEKFVNALVAVLSNVEPSQIVIVSVMPKTTMLSATFEAAASNGVIVTFKILTPSGKVRRLALQHMRWPYTATSLRYVQTSPNTVVRAVVTVPRPCTWMRMGVRLSWRVVLWDGTVGLCCLRL
jgi:hypothetical protein